MIRATHASGDVIRKAGKSTVVLQVFAVALLILLAWVYSNISTRYSELHDGIRENALWSVYQLDREAARFREELGRIILSADTSAEALKRISLRYDILYSRMATLDQTRFEQYFATDKTVRAYLQTIKGGIYSNAPLFDAVATGKPPTDKQLNTLQTDVSDVARNTEQLLNYSNNALSIARAESRDILSALARESMALIGLITACVVFLIYTLRRQLRNVRAAGLSLEAMAERFNTSFQAADAGNRAKSQFMATIGHEIRTPLNAILGMVELLELTVLPDHVRPNIKTIQRSGEALLDIINEILDFSKIEHGKLELEYRPVNLTRLIENAAEMMRGRAADGGNALFVDIPVALTAPNIRTDPTRLRQVVLNLLGNAIKFTAHGAVTLVVQQVGTPSALRLRIEVRDTGIGIDATGMQRLFQPFSQVDASISRKYGGTGLGLTICKEIITAMGGEIGVKSVPGEGSTFWLEVPVEAVATAEQFTPETKDAAPKPLPRLDILVVEDNAVNQQVALQFLRHLGQTATLAENGAVAVHEASKRRFDLILMDMQMPIMDGIEATRHIKSGGGPCSQSPIIAMTANASEHDREACLKAGMVGFQLKPIALHQLHALIAGFQPVTPLPDTRLSQAHIATRSAELIAVLGEQVFEGLLQTFFDDAVDLLTEMKTAMQDGNRLQIDICLHTLKGAAANLGLDAIADRSQSLRGATPDLAAVKALSDVIDVSRHKFSR